jgi:hypothetical protein
VCGNGNRLDRGVDGLQNDIVVFVRVSVSV